MAEHAARRPRRRRAKRAPASGREAGARCSRQTDNRVCRRRIDTAFSSARPLSPARQCDLRHYTETSCGRALFPRVFRGLLAAKKPISDPTCRLKLPVAGRSRRLLYSGRAFRAISVQDLAYSGPQVGIARPILPRRRLEDQGDRAQSSPHRAKRGIGKRMRTHESLLSLVAVKHPPGMTGPAIDLFPPTLFDSTGESIRGGDFNTARLKRPPLGRRGRTAPRILF